MKIENRGFLYIKVRNTHQDGSFKINISAKNPLIKVLFRNEEFESGKSAVYRL